MEDTTTVIAPPLPTLPDPHKDPTSKESVTSSIPLRTRDSGQLPSSCVLQASSGPVQETELIELSCLVWRTKTHKGVETSRRIRRGTTMRATEHGRLPSTRDERPGRASFRAKTRVSTGVEAGTNCGVRSHRAKRFLPAQESSACKQSAALTERACDTPRDATRVFKARARMDSFHMVMARQTTRIRRIRPRRWRLKRRACDDVCVG